MPKIVQKEYLNKQNMLPSFKSGKWIIHANATVIDDWNLRLVATAAYQISYFEFNCIPGQLYTFCGTGTGKLGITSKDFAGVSTSLYGYDVLKTVSVVTPANATKLIIGLSSQAAGTFTFSNIMLLEGPTAVFPTDGIARYIGEPTRRTLSDLQTSETVTKTFNPQVVTVVRPDATNHKAYYTGGSVNAIPTAPGTELNSTQYQNTQTKDSSTLATSTGTVGNYVQNLFSFDITKLGHGSRDAIVNALKSLKFGWVGYGKGDNAGATNTAVAFYYWNKTSLSWSGIYATTNGTVGISTPVEISPANFTDYVDANGKVWVLVKTQYPASATIASELYTDVAALTVELDKFSVGRTLSISVDEGIISGVIDSDTGIATVTADASGVNTISVNDASKFANGDYVAIQRKWYTDTVGQISSVDITNKTITFIGQPTVKTGDTIIETTASTSSPTLTNATATFAGLGTKAVTATLTAVTDATKPIAVTYSVNYPANQGLTYKPEGTILDVVNAEAGVEIKGRTLVNLLGKDGNMENDSNADGVADGLYAAGQNTTTKSLDSSNAKYGSYCQRVSVGDSLGNRFFRRQGITFEQGKYYIALVDAKSNVSQNILFKPAYSDWSQITSKSFTLGTSYQTLYVKITVASTATNAMLILDNTSTTSADMYFDGLRLYEIDQATYNKIDVDPEFTGEKLAQKFPYVDSVQFKSNVLLTQVNKNLAPTTVDEWEQKSIDITMGSVYPVNGVTNTTRLRPINPMYIIPSRTYSFSVVSGYEAIWAMYNSSDIVIASTGLWHQVQTINPPANATKISVVIRKTGGTVDILPSEITTIQPQLELGSVASTYIAQDKALAHTPLQIANDESVYLMPQCAIYKEAWKKNVVLDGNLLWNFSASITGFKEFSTLIGDCVNASGIVVDNTGSIYIDSATVASGTQRLDGTNKKLWLRISNSISGFIDSINPNGNAIKALMNGWKATANDGSKYSSWVSIIDGSAPATNTEAYVAANKATGYTPYMLHYKLANPIYHVNYLNDDTTKPIMSEGSVIRLAEGIGQVEQRTGVVRENGKPFWNVNVYSMNGSNETQKFNYRAKMGISIVRRDNIIDTKWYKSLGYNAIRGDFALSVPIADYFPDAIYNVTYEQLDKHLYTIDTFSLSNPTLSAYPYKDTANDQHSVGYFSFKDQFTIGTNNKQVQIAKGGLKGFAAYYEYNSAPVTYVPWFAPTLNPLQGTIEVLCNINTITNRQVAGQYNRLFRLLRGDNLNSAITVYHDPGAALWFFATTNDLNVSTSQSVADTNTTDGINAFSVCWDAVSALLDINGINKATITSPNLPSLFSTNTYIGCDTGSKNYLDTIFFDVSYSSIKRTQADRTARAEFAKLHGYFPSDSYVTWQLKQIKRKLF